MTEYRKARYADTENMPDVIQQSDGTYELDTILEDFHETKVYIYVNYSAFKIFEMCNAIALVPNELERTCKIYQDNWQGLIERFCKRGYTF